MIDKIESRFVSVDIESFNKVRESLRSGAPNVNGIDEDLRLGAQVVDSISKSMLNAKQQDNEAGIDSDPRIGHVSYKQRPGEELLTIQDSEGGIHRTNVNTWHLDYDPSTGKNISYTHEYATEGAYPFSLRSKSTLFENYFVDGSGRSHYIHRAEGTYEGPNSNSTGGANKTEVIIDPKKGTVTILIEKGSHLYPLTG